MYGYFHPNPWDDTNRHSQFNYAEYDNYGTRYDQTLTLYYYSNREGMGYNGDGDSDKSMYLPVNYRYKPNPATPFNSNSYSASDGTQGVMKGYNVANIYHINGLQAAQTSQQNYINSGYTVPWWYQTTQWAGQ